GLRQWWGAGVLRRGRTASETLGEVDSEPRRSRGPEQLAVAGEAVESHRGGEAMQSVAETVLRSAAGQGETQEGRHHRLHAQAAAGDLQRGEESQAVRGPRLVHAGGLKKKACVDLTAPQTERGFPGPSIWRM